MGIANGKDRDLLKKKIKEIKTGVEKEKKIQEKERKAKEKEQKKQLLKKKWREVMVEEAVKGGNGGGSSEGEGWRPTGGYSAALTTQLSCRVPQRTSHSCEQRTDLSLCCDSL